MNFPATFGMNPHSFYPTILNRANFDTPNLIVFTPPTATNLTGLYGTAGAITSTSTTERQVQFALKFLW